MELQNNFIDTNVILDVLLKREKLFQSSAEILGLAERKKIQLGTSIISYATIFYFVKKELSKEEFIIKMRQLKSYVFVFPSDQLSVDFALNSNFPDLEDAMQNHIAESNKCSTIITRNTKHFKKSNLAVLTPEEFLATQDL